MKTLVSAETVRQAHARGDKCLPGGKDVLVTPEARGLAEQLGIPFVVDAVSVSAPTTGVLQGKVFKEIKPYPFNGTVSGRIDGQSGSGQWSGKNKWGGGSGSWQASK